MSWTHYTTVYLAKHVGFPPGRILVLPLLLLEQALDGLEKDPQSPEERQTWWHGESRLNSMLSVWSWAVGLLGFSRAQTSLPQNGRDCPPFVNPPFLFLSSNLARGSCALCHSDSVGRLEVETDGRGEGAE